MDIKERFIDPFTDFGFKKLFGSEPNKDLLIDFLNQLLQGRKQIKTLSFSTNEHLGKTYDYRKAIFDLYCTGSEGEKFIIELQRVKQQFFKDRSIYYSTFPIQEQAPEGETWNYQLNEVYTIGIMDFVFDDSNQFLHEIMLLDLKTKEVYYDKLNYFYLEMPKFNKTENELLTQFDKWLYLLKNLNNFQEIPSILQEKVFRKAFRIAEVANLNEEEMKTYDQSLKDRRDWQNVLDYAIGEAREKGMKRGRQEGRQEGRLEGREEGRKFEKLAIAKQMKEENYPVAAISRITGLSPEEIENL